mmetsp:Transcript_40958/g.96148  ORF Transcript_40958/g.96148 Transcript_40958/m.96148 type:complete len:92 (+) Transcript_40958:125-400(+)
MILAGPLYLLIIQKFVQRRVKFVEPLVFQKKFGFQKAHEYNTLVLSKKTCLISYQSFIGTFFKGQKSKDDFLYVIGHKVCANLLQLNPIIN